MILLLLLLGSASAASDVHNSGGTLWLRGLNPTNSTEAPGALKSSVTVAIVNDYEFHHEVVMGLVHLFSQFKVDIKVVSTCVATVIAPNGWKRHPDDCGYGGAEMLASLATSTGRVALVRAGDISSLSPVDIAVFASPFFCQNTPQFVAALKPKCTVFIVHDIHHSTAAENFDAFTAALPQAHVVALAPHAARHVASKAARGKRISWMLPTLPVNCSSICQKYTPSHSAFAVQGKFEHQRRNYTGERGMRGDRGSCIPTISRRIAHLHCASTARNSKLARVCWTGFEEKKAQCRRA